MRAIDNLRLCNGMSCRRRPKQGEPTWHANYCTNEARVANQTRRAEGANRMTKRVWRRLLFDAWDPRRSLQDAFSRAGADVTVMSFAREQVIIALELVVNLP